MKPIVVWVPNQGYHNESGGIKVLFAFCNELNKAGQQAYVSQCDRVNPEWNTPIWPGGTNDFIAVYPEIVQDNPLNASKVVRYILYKQQRDIPEGETFICFMNMFNIWNLPDDHILYLPVIETEIFVDKGLPRQGKCVYFGKGINNPRVPETNDCYEITKGFTLDKEALCDKLNRTEILYTYDNMTAMNEIARLCGCPVVIIPDNSFSKEEYSKHELGMEGLGYGIEETEWAKSTVNSEAFHKKYQDLVDQFRVKIKQFTKYIQ